MDFKVKTNIAHVRYIAYKMGQLLSIAVAVILNKLQKCASDYHAGMERVQKRSRGQHRVGKRGGWTELLTEAATLLKYTRWGKEAVKKLGKHVIMVHGFLTYRGTLFVPIYMYGHMWFTILLKYGSQRIRKE